MKKTILLILFFLILASSLAGCDSKTGKISDNNDVSSQFVPFTDAVDTHVDPPVSESLNKDDFKIPGKTEVGRTSEPDSEGLDWSAISENGVDEALFLENLDLGTLEEIAEELQALVREEKEEERKNPELVLTEGWVRVFDSARYNKVLDMGQAAMKPLYWIIYKSPNTGIYEYICANALYELSGFDFSAEDGALTWSTSKELLEQFNKRIMEDKKD